MTYCFANWSADRKERRHRFSWGIISTSLLEKYVLNRNKLLVTSNTKLGFSQIDTLYRSKITRQGYVATGLNFGYMKCAELKLAIITLHHVTLHCRISDSRFYIRHIVSIISFFSKNSTYFAIYIFWCTFIPELVNRN